MTTIKLYSTDSDARVVNKNLTEIAATNIIPSAAFNILSPNIVIAYNDNYISANYCYISALQRYYFIQSSELELGKRIILHCTVDVLMSYKTQLIECSATVIRSESLGSNYVIDTQYPVDSSRRFLEWVEFPNQPFVDSTPNVVLTLQTATQTQGE